MSDTLAVFYVIAAIIALAGTVLTFIFILPEKRRAKLPGVLRFISDIFQFKFLIVEKIFQALYILSTIFCVAYGFLMLFLFDTHTVYSGSYYDLYETSTRLSWEGWPGIFVMILGPIVIRFAYELIMMGVLLVKNVIQINNKLKSEDADTKDAFSTPGFVDIKKTISGIDE